MLSDQGKFLLSALHSAINPHPKPGVVTDPIFLDSIHALLLIEKGLGATGAFTSPELVQYQQLSAALWKEQRLEIEKTLAAFRSAGYKFAVIKGADIAARWYAEMPLCFRGDIDVLIEEADRTKVKDLMCELGYMQGQLNIETCQIEPFTQDYIDRREDGNYSLPSFGKVKKLHGISSSQASLVLPESGWRKPVFVYEGAVFAAITFDFATGLDAVFPASEIFDDAEPSLLDQGLGVSPTDTLWYCLALYYLEISWHGATTRLTRLAEIGRMLSQENLIDWDKFVRICIALEIRPNVYYFLRFLQRTFGVRVPAETLTQLEPWKGNRARDYGWQLYRLFGETEPFPIGFDSGALEATEGTADTTACGQN